MRTERLYKGQYFKNYRILCEELGMPIRAGNAKKAQMKELERYCRIQQVGHSLTVVEVYLTPLERVGRRGEHMRLPSLKITNPRLAEEWVCERNGKLKDNITRRSEGVFWWECLSCNSLIYSPMSKRFRKKGFVTDEDVSCLYCTLSAGAKMVADVLMEEGLKFTTEYRYEDLRGVSNGHLRFDFAVLSEDDSVEFLIEYDGEFHFYPNGGSTIDDSMRLLDTRQHHDSEKNNYCKDNRVSLIRIYFFEQDVARDKLLSSISKISKGELVVHPTPEEVSPAEVFLKDRIRFIDSDLARREKIVHDNKTSMERLRREKEEILYELRAFDRQDEGNIL